MKRNGDMPAVAGQINQSNDKKSAALKTPGVWIAGLMVAQLALMVCSWAVPSLHMAAAMISFIVCAAGLVSLRWLMSTAQRSVADSTASLAERSASEAQAVRRLADELEPLLKGDLRVRASIPEQDLAARVARTVNHTVTELRWLVGRFQEFGSRIDSSVELPRTELRELQNEYRGQAAEIHESANALAAMTSAMSSLSAATRHASGQAQQAAREANLAARFMSGNKGRLARTREEAGNAKRIVQRLSRTATSANILVGSIAEVARRADLLALNSTLQVTTKAAGNVELSRLSEEVSELAVRLGTTSSDMAHLIGTIQQDAVDTMAAIQQTNRDVSTGFDQLDQLSSTLKSVTRSSTDLHALVDQMAEKTLLQTGVVKRVYSRMVSINDLSDSYTSGARAWSNSLDELQTLARELRSSVADFQLPSVPKPVRAIETSPAVSSQHRSQNNSALTDER